MSILIRKYSDVFDPRKYDSITSGRIYLRYKNVFIDITMFDNQFSFSCIHIPILTDSLLIKDHKYYLNNPYGSFSIEPFRFTRIETVYVSKAYSELPFKATLEVYLATVINTALSYIEPYDLRYYGSISAFNDDFLVNKFILEDKKYAVSSHIYIGYFVIEDHPEVSNKFVITNQFIV